jgi:hypothetical protein
MIELPDTLELLTENRREILAILDALDGERDPTPRADLAGELIGSSARYEDVMDRVVYPALRNIKSDWPELDRAEADQATIRDLLSELRGRTQHVKPANVHASDPEGFEDLVDRLVDSERAQLDREDEALFPLLSQLGGPEADALSDDVRQAVAHASTLPHPPHHALGRAVTGVMEKLNHVVHDQSTVSHPEIDKLHEDLEETSESE